MLNQFHPEFVAVYKVSRSRLPIHIWAEAVGKNLAMFENAHNKIYKPVNIRVRLKKNTSDPENTINLDIPLGDKQWYENLVDAVAVMTGRQASSFSIVDEDGRCIKGQTFEDLVNSADMRVLDKRTQKQVYVSEILEPPRSIQTDKGDDIIEWFKGIQSKLATKLTTVLAGNDMPGIAKAVSVNGLVQNTIKDFLIGNVPSPLDWPRFLQTYAGSDQVRALNPEKVAEQLAKSTLVELRQTLKTHERQIQHYFASAHADENLWSNPINESLGSKRYHSDVEMFEDIVDSAIFSPTLETKFFYTIHNGQNVECHMKKKKEKEKEEEEEEEEIEGSIDPLHRFYHGHYFEKFGHVPKYAMTQFSNNVGSQIKMSPEEIKEVDRAFFLFSGRAPFPEDIIKTSKSRINLRKVASMLIPKLKPYNISTNISTEAAHLIPVMPDTVPIESVMHYYENKDDIKGLFDNEKTVLSSDFPLF